MLTLESNLVATKNVRPNVLVIISKLLTNIPNRLLKVNEGIDCVILNASMVTRGSVS